MQSKKGFTLLEILLVVGIIAILAGIVIIAINPGRQLAQTRNAERRSDIRQIKSAMEQFYIDKGYYPASTTLAATTSLIEICDTGASSSPSGITCTGKLNLSELVPVYITAIPKDPQATTTNSAGYKVAKDASNKLITTAPQAELSVFIAIGTTTSSGGGLGIIGLVAHYLMNDITGLPVVDDNIGVHDGSANSSISVGGKINTALRTNSSYITFLNSSDFEFGNGDFGISFWVKRHSGVGGFLCRDSQSMTPWIFYYNSDQFQLYGTSGSGWDIATAKVLGNPTGNLDHIVLTRSGNNFTVYFNNQITNQWSSSVSFAPSSGNMIIGLGQNVSVVDVTIDDLRIYKGHALSSNDVAALNSAGSGTEAE